MKKKRFYQVLIIEAIACVLTAIISVFLIKLGQEIYIVYLPMELIGKCLRYLSLSGGFGNIIAWAVYLELSLMPLALFYAHRRKGKKMSEDVLLFILSIYSFCMWYYFINPLKVSRIFSDILHGKEWEAMGLCCLAIGFFSILIGYILIRMMNGLNTEKEQKNPQMLAQSIVQRLNYILQISAIIYTFFVAYVQLSYLLKQILGAKDTINAAFVIMRFAANLIPAILAIMIIIVSSDLVLAFAENRNGKNMESCSLKLSRLGKKSVSATLIMCISINLLQLLFAEKLFDVNLFVIIPILPLILAFTAYIFADYFRESRKNYEENQMII